MRYFTTVNDQEFVIEIDHEGQVTVNDRHYSVDFQLLPERGILSLLLDHHSLEAVVEARDDVWQVLIRGELYSVLVQDERAYRLAQARGSGFEHVGEASIRSPMPGLIIDVPVEEGSEVSKGDKVIILESMKMENELRAPRDGIVTHIYVQKGANVEKDQVLVSIGDALPAE